MTKKAFERPSITKLSPGVPSKHGTITAAVPLTHIDGVSVDALMDEFGSPLFIFSEREIRRSMEDIRRAFTVRYPGVQMAWSYKTNYLDAICRIFHSEGSWAEVVSGFEYDKALKNGVSGDRIIFNGPGKTSSYLEKAVKHGSFIHIDNFDELSLLSDICISIKAEARVAVRVNMDTGISPRWDRFGFNLENGDADEAVSRIMENKRLKLTGLHTHIGTYIMSTDAYRAAASRLADLAAGIEKKYGHNIAYIDMGGGFASRNTLRGAFLSADDTTPGFDEYAEAITAGLLNSALNRKNLPALILETGRALVDNSGFVAGTVLANKRLADGRRAIIADAGVNLLFTSYWYDHRIQPTCNTTSRMEDTAVYGPLCMNIDVIRPSVMFPSLKLGERFVISRTGAYNVTQWQQFINLRPNVVLISMNKQVHLIRKAETLEDISSNELIPDYLK